MQNLWYVYAPWKKCCLMNKVNLVMFVYLEGFLERAKYYTKSFYKKTFPLETLSILTQPGYKQAK